MPIYNYKCATCGKTKEVLQKYDDPAPLCDHFDPKTRRGIMLCPLPMDKQLNASYGFTFKRGKGTSGGDSMRMPAKQPVK